MNDRQSDPNRNDCGCEPGGCCPPPLPRATRRPAAARRNRTTAIFAAILLLAVGVTAHSILKARGKSRPAPAGEAQALSEVAGASAQAAGSASLAAAADARELQTVEALLEQVAQHDFVFAILPGPDDPSAREAAQGVAAVAEKIRARGAGVETFMFRAGSEGLARAVDCLRIEHLPAVLALRQGCHGSVINGDFSETNVLKAYHEAQKTSCSGSGCACGSASGGGCGCGCSR